MVIRATDPFVMFLMDNNGHILYVNLGLSGQEGCVATQCIRGFEDESSISLFYSSISQTLLVGHSTTDPGFFL